MSVCMSLNNGFVSDSMPVLLVREVYVSTGNTAIMMCSKAGNDLEEFGDLSINLRVQLEKNEFFLEPSMSYAVGTLSAMGIAFDTGTKGYVGKSEYRIMRLSDEAFEKMDTREQASVYSLVHYEECPWRYRLSTDSGPKR